MSWRFKLANWLSGGLLSKYQKESESSKSKLLQEQINVDNLKKQLQYTQKEAEQAKAQLLIAKGFQQELGEAQLKVRQLSYRLFQYQEHFKQLKQKEQEPSSAIQVSSTDWYQQLQQTVEVVEIKRLPPQDFDSLWGFSIASPQAEVKIEGGSTILQGWVLGKKALATAIRINYQGETLVETPVNLPSPHVTQYYPDITAAGNCGFETSLSVVGMPESAKLEIQAVLENEDTVNLSTITLKRS